MEQYQADCSGWSWSQATEAEEKNHHVMWSCDSLRLFYCYCHPAITKEVTDLKLLSEVYTVLLGDARPYQFFRSCWSDCPNVWPSSDEPDRVASRNLGVPQILSPLQLRLGGAEPIPPASVTHSSAGEIFLAAVDGMLAVRGQLLLAHIIQSSPVLNPFFCLFPDLRPRSLLQSISNCSSKKTTATTTWQCQSVIFWLLEASNYFMVFLNMCALLS